MAEWEGPQACKGTWQAVASTRLEKIESADSVLGFYSDGSKLGGVLTMIGSTCWTSQQQVLSCRCHLLWRLLFWYGCDLLLRSCVGKDREMELL